LVFFATSALRAEDPVPTPASVREQVEQWAKLRQEAIRLEEDWEWKRGIIENNTEALRKRQEAIRKQTQLIQATSANELRRMDELQDRASAAQASIDQIGENLDDTVARLMALRSQLPPRLSRALELPYLSLTDDSLPPGERMQIVMTIFNRCAQFNKSIHLSQESVALDEGEEKMLEVLYWGLAQGYALDRQAGKAYRGYPEDGAWIWVPEAGIADKVAQAIDIFNEDQDPAFVSLPVMLND